MQWIIQDKFKLLKVIYLNEFVFAAVVELPSYVLKVLIIAFERQMRKKHPVLYTWEMENSF